MIDEKFMNQIIETLNMRAVEEIEQYAGQTIDTVDSGIFIALERWLRLKEDFLSADISPKVIEPISPRGENGQEAVKQWKEVGNPENVRNELARLNAKRIEAEKPFTIDWGDKIEGDPAIIAKQLFKEREAWEAKRERALDLIKQAEEVAYAITKESGLFTREFALQAQKNKLLRICNMLNEQLAVKDEVQKFVGFGLAKENTEEDEAKEFERCLRPMREREEWEAKRAQILKSLSKQN